MDTVHGIWTFLTDNWGSLATGLFFISEALASIPSVKANSVFQLLAGMLKPKAPVV